MRSILVKSGPTVTVLTAEIKRKLAPRHASDVPKSRILSKKQSVSSKMPITPPENAALFLLCGKKYSPETGSSKNGSDTFKAIGAPSRKNSFTSGRRFIISHSVLKSLKDKKKKSIIPTGRNRKRQNRKL